MKSINDIKTEIESVLNKGIEQKLIDRSDYDKALTTFDEFSNSHPDYTFYSPREKMDQMGKQEDEKLKAEEQQLWNTLQPILDKAQAVHTSSAEENASILASAREADPLHASDFTSTELEKLRKLAPEEYKKHMGSDPITENVTI